MTGPNEEIGDRWEDSELYREPTADDAEFGTPAEHRQQEWLAIEGDWQQQYEARNYEMFEAEYEADREERWNL